MGVWDKSTTAAREQHHACRHTDTGQEVGRVTIHLDNRTQASTPLAVWQTHYCLFVFQKIAKEVRRNEVMDRGKESESND